MGRPLLWVIGIVMMVVGVAAVCELVAFTLIAVVTYMV
jgi:hypothetical protein